MAVIALEYHDVIDGEEWDDSGFPGSAAASYKLALRSFRGHLDVLAASSRLVGSPIQRALSDAKDSVILTFDDGGASAATIGRLLAERGWSAHVFVTTDCIGARGFLDREALLGLHGAGHIVGSHSATHPTRMSRLSRADLRLEWRRSVSVLEDVLGASVKVASVPGGYFSRGVAEAAAEAGIEILFTSEPITRLSRVDSCVVLGRYTLRRGHAPGYLSRLVGGWPAARMAQWVRWNTRKVGKRLGGEAYLRLRETHFNRGAF